MINKQLKHLYTKGNVKRGDRYLLHNKLQDTGLQMSSFAQDPKLPKEQQMGHHEDSFPVKTEMS